MSYKDFLWEDQTVNGILVKTVRVRVREVSSSDKISVEKSSTGYSDGNTDSVKRSRRFRDFTIILKSEVPRTTGNYKAKKENKHFFLRLYVYIVPEKFEFETFENLKSEFVENDLEKYPYFESAIRQYLNQ